MLAYLGYLMFMAIVRLMQWLPFGALYKLSDALYGLFYTVIGYRRRVIAANLRRAFPDKAEADIQVLVRKFYRRLVDIILETLKGITLPEKALLERMHFANPELLNNEMAKGKNLLLCGAHYNNWEWATFAAGQYLTPNVVGIYKDLSNPYINTYYFRQRSRLGTRLANMRKILRTIVTYEHRPATFVFINDQAPFNMNYVHWVDFLNIDTPFISGLDKIAHETNYPVYFCRIHYLRRGYYSAAFELLAEQPAQLPDGEITKRFADALASQILDAPEHWLWSHRRWKKTRADVPTPAAP